MENYADLQIVYNPLLTTGLRGMAAAYTPRVAGRRAEIEEPEWRVRIRRAVAPHGQLKAIAKAAKMTSPQLQKIANGTTGDPGVSTMARIAEAMGMTLPDLVSPRSEDGAERARQQRREGSALLEGVVQSIDSETTLREDVARAVAILRDALERERRRESSSREAADTGRRAVADS